MFLLPWAPKRGAFMAKGHHSRGCHRGLGGSCPKLPPSGSATDHIWCLCGEV